MTLKELQEKSKEQRDKLKEQREKITEKVCEVLEHIDIEGEGEVELRWWSVNQLSIKTSPLKLNQTFDLMCYITDMFDVDTIEYYADEKEINVKIKVNS